MRLLRGEDAPNEQNRDNRGMSSAAERLAAPQPARPRIPAWAINGVLAILIIGSAFLPFSETGFRSTTLFTLIITLLPAAILPFRHRWPIPVLAGFIAFYGVGALAGTLAPGLVLAIAVAMFSLANRTNRRTTVIAGVSAMLAIGVLSLLAALGSVFDPRVVQFLFTVAFAAAAGDGARSRREFIAAITDRAVRAEETKEAEAKRRVTEERLRIARDLHDVVAHQIAVISLNAGVASASLESRPEKAKESLGTIRSAARVVLGEIGDLLEILRSDSDDPADAALPQPGLDGLDELVETFASSGLTVQLRIEGELDRVSAATALVAYRVIQEALTNAHKYGAEGRAHVLVEVVDDSMRVVVTNPSRVADFGEGGSAAATAGAAASGTGTGLGLVGLRERVASVRGTVETGFVGGSYRVVATLPVIQGETR
ncbi:signal transduction histidine kinase [Salinibacterium amurskyense]|uniref:histidine kinase n=2 Tax=Salinibacterium amurskyense TaxID=205941 RepID=A0A2M9D7V7_9MICO|nr:signal transduction histidine kinase [Salinibacterium amurskyense]RLQ83725.1 sensor histidine kinase [Salinibacterium amurskyense]GHD79403.1 two-component sensor histidine kinase [Salinibacterium amurskyense]